MIFHTLCLVCVAAAYDDQSLMQQGVGIETNLLETSTAEVWRSNLGIVQDAVKEIPFPGKMRQMAIDALMKSVSKHRAPSAAVQNLFNQIITVLNTVKADLLKARNDAQADIDEVITGVTKCNTGGEDDLAQAVKTASESRHTHENCRTGDDLASEAGATTNRNTNCNSLMSTLWDKVAKTNVDDLSDLEGPDACRERGGNQRTGVSYHTDANGLMPSSKVEGLEHLIGKIYGGNLRTTAKPNDHVNAVAQVWGDYFSANYNAWNDVNTLWVDNEASCNSAVKTFLKVAATCDSAQGKFETDFCSQWNDGTDLCANRPGCYSKVVKNYHTAIATHSGVTDGRVRVVNIIDRVLCLIEELLKNDFNGVDLSSTCVLSAEFLANTSTYYNITERTPEDEKDCTDPNASRPGTQGFLDNHYSMIAANLLDTVQVCVRVPDTSFGS